MKYYDKLYNKLYDKAQKTLTNKALKKFVKSDYLRDTTSILPLTLLTLLIRGIFNFLITSRLKTNYIYFDFPFSIFITVSLTLFSPILYNHISKSYDKEIKDFSKNVIDSYYTQGWIFIEVWKSRILGSIGVGIISILFFVEVNSFMIQEFIFHTMISSIIVDYLTNEVDSDNIENNENNDNVEKVKIIEVPKKVESYNNLIAEEDREDKKELDYEIITDYSLQKEGFMDLNMFDDDSNGSNDSNDSGD